MPNLVPYFSLIMQKLKTTSPLQDHTRHTTARPHTIVLLKSQNLKDVILYLFQHLWAP